MNSRPSEPRVGVGALVIESGKILLVKRKYPPSRGKWSIPGGHVELGESILETARRELKEETGVEAIPLGVVNVDDYIAYDERGIRYHYVLITVLLKSLTYDVDPGSDALDAGFFTLEEAESLDLTVSTRGLLKKLRERVVDPEGKILKVNTYRVECLEN
ncbi:MAG: NUDIX hydrolase [Desulfurococcales archaeon]|nr:NUDIX hydrolase [Desulfurococcales archaeon]